MARRRFPPIPGDMARGTISKLKELVEIWKGERGDTLDRVVTFRDLIDSRITIMGPGGGLLPAPGPPPGWGDDGGPPFMMVPPTPTGVGGGGAVQNIMIYWDSPTAAYRNHAYTEVWRSDIDLTPAAECGDDVGSDGNSVRIATEPGFMYVDPVGPGKTYYYWVRFVNTDGICGPFHALGGFEASTGIDVEYMLDQLTGEITESHLYQHLNDRIDLIDDPDTGLVSQVNQIATQFGDDIAAVESRMDTVENDLGGLSAQWSVKTQVGNLVGGIGLYNNGVQTSFYVRADRFVVYNPQNFNGRIPFMVVDGVVYMDTAAIRDATITTAKIQNGFLDNLTAAKGTLAQARIQKGDIFNLTISGSIQSEVYVAGSLGWHINKLGNAEFNDAIFRGHVVMNTGQINALDVVDTLQLRGQAVTIPRASIERWEHTVSANNAWTTILEHPWTSSGFPTQVHWSFVGRRDGGAQAEFDYRVLAGVVGGTLSEVFYIQGAYAVWGASDRGGLSGSTRVQPPTALLFTVVVQVRCRFSSQYFGERNVLTMETKR